MIKVVVLGAGNVASHLVHAFVKAKDVQLVQVYARSASALKAFAIVATTTNIDALAQADVYIIAVTDDAIDELSSAIPITNKLVVHTSGSVAMDVLDSKNRRGVFYPLQTFTTGKKIDFTQLPICIEAEANADLVLLEKLASAISNNTFFIDSVQRKSLHVAAVFVNNFVNHLYYIGHQICEEHQVPFEVLAPLIKETAKKIEEMAPLEAQTGPAKRNDIQTIQAHLAMLTKEQQDIYKLLTQSIKKTYGEKL